MNKNKYPLMCSVLLHQVLNQVKVSRMSGSGEDLKPNAKTDTGYCSNPEGLIRTLIRNSSGLTISHLLKGIDIRSWPSYKVPSGAAFETTYDVGHRCTRADVPESRCTAVYGHFMAYKIFKMTLHWTGTTSHIASYLNIKLKDEHRPSIIKVFWMYMSHIT